MSGPADPNPDLDDETTLQQELDHFRKMVKAVLFYKQHAKERLVRAQRSFDLLAERHQNMLVMFPAKIEGLHRAIEANASLLVEIAKGCGIIGLDFEKEFCDLMDSSIDDDANDGLVRPPPDDMEKVYTTLKQFVRDWSSEGAAERTKCYGPVIDAITTHYKDLSVAQKSKISIVVPGAGLGRLVWEFANRGFKCQGNEWSTFMLLASNHILNIGGLLNQKATHHTQLFPFAHQFSNNYDVEDQMRAVTIPDADPTDVPDQSMSMTMGDFLQVYTEEASCDCIASCFFIDTARNPIVYLECMYKMLKPGGILVNLGPLLYHFADSQGAPSVELAYAEVRECCKSIGFKFLVEKYPLNAPYIDSTKSMVTLSYNCVLFVVQKPEKMETNKGSKSGLAAPHLNEELRHKCFYVQSRIQAAFQGFRDQINETVIATSCCSFFFDLTRNGEIAQRWRVELKTMPGVVVEIPVQAHTKPSRSNLDELDLTVTMTEEQFTNWIEDELSLVTSAADGELQVSGDSTCLVRVDKLGKALQHFWMRSATVEGITNGTMKIEPESEVLDIKSEEMDVNNDERNPKYPKLDTEPS